MFGFAAASAIRRSWRWAESDASEQGGRRDGWALPFPGGVWALSRGGRCWPSARSAESVVWVGTEAWGGHGTGPQPAGHLRPPGCSDAGLVVPQAPLVSLTERAVVLAVSGSQGFGREAAMAGQSPGPSRGSCLQPAFSTLGPAFGRLGTSVWLLPKASLTRVLWRRGIGDRCWAADEG